jgi:phosphoglycerol transferase MdoB-like AlkP superfamily enzyme
MVLAIYAKKIVRAMVIAVLLITLVSFVARVAMYMWGVEGYLQPLRIFDVGEERSIPTWFESILFLLCSILLAVVAVASKQRNDRYSLHWNVLSIILLLLSLDEVASIHEAIGQQSERLLHSITGLTPSGAISFFWVVPGTIFVVIVLLAYLRFLADLPRSTRRLFLFAGVLFVLGALGLEMLTAQVMSSSGSIADWVASSSGGMIGPERASAIPKILKGLQTCVEEMFEMLGLTAFVYALLAYIGSYVEDISVRVRIDKSA